MAQRFEDGFYIPFGQRSRLLYFFSEIVGVDMLKVDYPCVVEFFVLFVLGVGRLVEFKLYCHDTVYCILFLFLLLCFGCQFLDTVKICFFYRRQGFDMIFLVFAQRFLFGLFVRDRACVLQNLLSGGR